MGGGLEVMAESAPNRTVSLVGYVTLEGLNLNDEAGLCLNGDAPWQEV